MSATATMNGEVVSTAKRFDSELLEGALDTLDVCDLGEGLKLACRLSVDLDHALATGLLNMLEFSSDRPLDNNHVMKLLTAMKRGTFMPEQVQIITCKMNGKEYRMNGQHTCWARLEMEEKYKCPIQHLKYFAKTENDMRRLYASIDRMKARSTGNIVCSYLFDTPEWKDYSKRTLVKLAEALAFWLWPKENDRNRRDGDDRSYLLQTDYFSLGQNVAKFLESSKGVSAQHIRRRPVVAAMLATFQKHSSSAIEFWTAVRDGTGFGSKNDPRLILRNGLMGASIAIGKGATAEKKSVSSEEIYRCGLYAWNTFRRGDAMKQLKAQLNCDRPKAV